LVDDLIDNDEKVSFKFGRRHLYSPYKGVFPSPKEEVGSLVACVRRVSVGLRSKERPRNGIFGVLPA